MDILKPDLQYIDGMCYRINPGNFASNYNKGNPQTYEYDEEFIIPQDGEIDDDFDVDTLPNGKLQTSFHVAKTFFSYLIGTKGSTKRRLENETKTVITIPKFGCEGDIVIVGAERRHVVSARNRVMSLVKSARKKMRPTHFISLPLNGEEFQLRFNSFKKNVLENCPGISEELFVDSVSLHITVCLMVLCDDVERTAAAEVLQLCHQQVIKDILKGELKVKISGLAYMNDDPSNVNILYAKATSLNEDLSLQTFVDAISQFFKNKGIQQETKNEKDNVLIHVTLMKAQFMKAVTDEKRTKIIPYDASKIFELYGDFDFGEGVVSSVELSIMHSNKPGYWPSTASISLL